MFRRELNWKIQIKSLITSLHFNKDTCISPPNINFSSMQPEFPIIMDHNTLQCMQNLG